MSKSKTANSHASVPKHDIAKLSEEQPSVVAEDVSFSKAIHQQENQKSFRVIKNRLLKTANKILQDIYTLLQVLPAEVEKYGEDAVFNYLKELLTHLRNIRVHLSDSDEAHVRSFFKTNILKFAHQSPFCRYAYEKPRGYPGDFMMMEMIWNGIIESGTQRYLGDTKTGQLLNAFTLDLDICKANILRTNSFKEFILQSPPNSKIASLGSGSILEVETAKRDLAYSGRHISLYDQDEGALEYAESKIVSEKISYSLNQGNLLKTIIKGLSDKYDYIYSSGLFDYFSTKDSKRLLGHVWKNINPGGGLLVSNVSDHNPSQLWMELVGDWYLVNKSEKELVSIVEDLPDLKRIEFDIDKYGAYQFIHAYKK